MSSGSALEDWMPDFQVQSRHTVLVAAPPAAVLAAVEQADLARPGLVRLLMGLRILPAVLAHPIATWRRWRRPRQPATLRSVLGADFVTLARTADELVLGIEGRFWTLSGGLVRLDPTRFRHGPAPGLAQAAWNFRVEAEGGATRLSTETRIRCGDRRSLARFRRYWRLVGPFSGLIRRSMLSMIRAEAEGGAVEP